MRPKQKQTMICFIAFIFLTASPLLGVSLFSGSDENRGPGQGGPGRKPPQEAYEACENKEATESCSMQTPHGEMSGSCRSIQGDLVCAPKEMPSNGRSGGSRGQKRSRQMRPPQEAYDVCENKEESDTCEFETVRGILSGTCQVLQGKFVCAPKRN